MTTATTTAVRRRMTIGFDMSQAYRPKVIVCVLETTGSRWFFGAASPWWSGVLRPVGDGAARLWPLSQAAPRSRNMV
ncbi:hypothetical protein GCM10009525_81340 [Streptosporangium amethystogenes subsp. fukuiense]